MHEAAFAQAALPATTVCLGMLLRPFSIGHELFLIREGNPLAARVEKPGRITKQDLAEAVLICSQSFAENERMAREFWADAKIRLWRWRCRRADFDMALATFQEYRDSGNLSLPPSGITTPGKTPGRIQGTPFLLRLHQFIITQLRMSEAAAWDYKLGMAKMHWCAWWEGEGCYEVYNEVDAAHDEFVREQEALLAKGGATCQA